MTRLLVTICLAFALQERPTPPPEPPEDRPACNNYYNTAPEHKCACAKAMKCNGHIDEPPDPDVPGMKWCSQYCRKDKCRCIGPCESMRHTKTKTRSAE
jgi:hypothetical protein